MKILKNQPIAREGALNYDGKWMMKKWDNLRQFIGTTVPIPDVHPLDETGRLKTFSNEKSWGFAEVKQCPNGHKQLCADLYLEDDAPDRAGYSIGFVYDELEEHGILDNERTYEGVQVLSKLDHLILTDVNRDPRALRLYGDSKDNDNNVNKYLIGYDTYMIENKTPIEGVNKIENKMSEELKDSLMTIGELQKELAVVNADSDTRLKERDSLIAKLQEALTVETDARKSKEKILGDSLRTEFAALKLDKEILENQTLESLKFAKIVGDAIMKLPRADDEIIEEVEGDSNLVKPILMKEWDIEKNEWVWM